MAARYPRTSVLSGFAKNMTLGRSPPGPPRTGCASRGLSAGLCTTFRMVTLSLNQDFTLAISSMTTGKLCGYCLPLLSRRKGQLKCGHATYLLINNFPTSFLFTVLEIIKNKKSSFTNHFKNHQYEPSTVLTVYTPMELQARSGISSDIPFPHVESVANQSMNGLQSHVHHAPSPLGTAAPRL